MWPLNRNGGRFPSWGEGEGGFRGGGGGAAAASGDDNDPPGTGGQVLPGRYKFVISFGGEKDSTYINVKLDPRTNLTVKDLEEKDAVMKNIRKMTDKATQAFNRLKEADKTVGLVDAQLAPTAPDSVKKEMTKWGKSLKDSILTVQKLFMAPRDVKGIVRTSDDLTNTIFSAMQLVGSSQGKPQGNAMITVEQTKEHLDRVLNKVNQFFEKDWKKYQDKVEAVKYSLFKKYEPIKND